MPAFDVDAGDASRGVRVSPPAGVFGGAQRIVYAAAFNSRAAYTTLDRAVGWEGQVGRNPAPSPELFSNFTPSGQAVYLRDVIITETAPGEWYELGIRLSPGATTVPTTFQQFDADFISVGGYLSIGVLSEGFGDRIHIRIASMQEAATGFYTALIPAAPVAFRYWDFLRLGGGYRYAMEMWLSWIEFDPITGVSVDIGRPAMDAERAVSLSTRPERGIGIAVPPVAVSRPAPQPNAGVGRARLPALEKNVLVSDPRREAGRVAGGVSMRRYNSERVPGRITQFVSVASDRQVTRAGWWFSVPLDPTFAEDGVDQLYVRVVELRTVTPGVSYQIRFSLDSIESTRSFSDAFDQFSSAFVQAGYVTVTVLSASPIIMRFRLSESVHTRTDTSYLLPIDVSTADRILTVARNTNAVGVEVALSWVGFEPSRDVTVGVGSSNPQIIDVSRSVSERQARGIGVAYGVADIDVPRPVTVPRAGVGRARLSAQEYAYDIPTRTDHLAEPGTSSGQFVGTGRARLSEVAHLRAVPGPQRKGVGRARLSEVTNTRTVPTPSRIGVGRGNEVHDPAVAYVVSNAAEADPHIDIGVGREIRHEIAYAWDVSKTREGDSEVPVDLPDAPVNIFRNRYFAWRSAGGGESVLVAPDFFLAELVLGVGDVKMELYFGENADADWEEAREGRQPLPDGVLVTVDVDGTAIVTEGVLRNRSIAAGYDLHNADGSNYDTDAGLAAWRAGGTLTVTFLFPNLGVVTGGVRIGVGRDHQVQDPAFAWNVPHSTSTANATRQKRNVGRNPGDVAVLWSTPEPAVTAGTGVSVNLPVTLPTIADVTLPEGETLNMKLPRIETYLFPLEELEVVDEDADLEITASTRVDWGLSK